MDVIVVGAGLAGLGAAWRLQQAGVRVQVLEATDGVGGRARSVEWQGFILDPGAQWASEQDRLWLQLVDELGLRSDLRGYEPALRQARLARRGKLGPFSPDLPGGLAWRGRLSAIGAAARRSRPGEPESLPGCDQRRTAAEYLAQVGGASLLDEWAAPLLAWCWGYAPADVSAGMLLHLAQAAGGRQWTLRGGLGLFARHLAARVHVANDARVTRIAAADGRATVTFMDNGQEEAREADAVVIAVPGALVGGLLDEVPDTWAPLLEHVAYTVGLAVYLMLEAPQGLALSPACRLAAGGDGGILAGLAVADRSADGRRLLLRAIPRVAAELIHCREDDIYALVESEMATLWPELAAAHVAGRWLQRWPHQAPCWRPGYLEALRRARPHLRRGPLFLAGDYLAGTGLGAALADGWACAEQVLRHGQG